MAEERGLVVSADEVALLIARLVRIALRYIPEDRHDAFTDALKGVGFQGIEED